MHSVSLSVDSAPLPPVEKTKRMQRIERQHGGADIREILGRTYVQVGGDWYATGRKLGLAKPTIFIWLRELGITTHVTVRLS